MRHSRSFRAAGVVLALGLVMAGCGGSDNENEPETAAADETDESTESASEGSESDDSGDAASGDTPEPVELSLVTSFPRAAIEHAGLNLFLENLEENAPWIEIDYRGASDVMEATMMGQSVSSGAVDMASLPPAYYGEQFPLASALHLATLDPAEQREAGIYDWLAERYREDFGIEYLGYVAGGIPFKFYMNEPMESADLSGRNVRVVQTYRAMVEELGGNPITMPGTEVYTAMERGVVDGFGWASVGVTFNGWHEVTNYEIEPGFYQMVLSLIMNDDKFDSLDPVTQQALTDTMAQSEKEVVELYQELAAEEQQERLDAGMELITLEGEEADRLVDTAYEEGWADAERLSPDAAEFRQLLEDAGN